jgi:exodeoxyribonuclease VIII
MANLIKKISDIEYFASEGLSNSKLLLFDKGPQYLKDGFKRTKAMEIGLSVHDYILQPELFKEQYLVLDESIKDRRSKDYKKIKTDNVGKELILNKDFQRIKSINNNIMNYEIKYDFNELCDDMSSSVRFFEIFNMDECKKEMAIYWDDEDFITEKTMQMKGKMDIWIEYPNHNIIIDLKKTDDVDKFIYSIRKFNYHRQAALYGDGLEQITGKPSYFYFFIFEYDNLYNYKLFKLDEQDVEDGRFANEVSINNYRNWDGVSYIIPSGVEIISSVKKYY